MRRFYQFLSLFLLSVVGITSAVAQDYKQGELIEDVAATLNKNIVLYAPGISGDHPAGYMCGTGGYTQTINNDCFVKFVPTGKKVDGQDTYVLQQVSTGKYFKDFALPINAYDATDVSESERNFASGNLTDMTDNLAEAFEMTVMPFEQVDGQEGQTRNSASAAKQDLSNTGFVLTRANTCECEDGGSPYVYIGGLAQPFYSRWVDTNVYQAYTVEDVKGYDKVENYVNTYCPNGTDGYVGGTNPGEYDATLLAEAQAAYNAAIDVLNGASISDADADALCERIKAAFEALKAAGPNPIATGYYFIKNDNQRFYSSNTVDGTEYIWAYQPADYTMPTELTVSDMKNVWKITPTEVKNQYKVQNVATKSYMTGDQKGNYYTLGADGVIGMACEGTNTNGAFIIYKVDPNNPDKHQPILCCNGGHNYLLTWNSLNDPNNNVHFFKVDDSVIAGLEGAAVQQAINDKLQLAYDKASAAYTGSLAITGAPKDDTFTGAGALVNDAETQYFTTTQDAAEGSLVELNDGNYTTFFHSDWHNGSFTPSESKYHYLGVDCGSDISTAISVKMARRLNDKNYKTIDYPTTVCFYGANDVDVASPDEATWTKLGSVKVTWDIPMVYNEEVTVADGIGVAGVPFDGSYRYFKMAVMATDQNRGYFALSEFNAYQGTVDPAGGTIAQVSEATKTEMQNELAKAKAELEAGTATEATIASLNAAYDKFMNELPDASKLTAAITAAKAVVTNVTNNGLVGEGIGYYPQANLDALNEAIATAEAYDAEGQTAAAINAQVATLNAAVEAFKASVSLPEAGKFYTVRGRSNKVNTYSKGLTSYGAQVYSENNSLVGGVRFTHADGASFDATENKTLTDEELAERVALLSDTVSAAYDARYLWLVEKAEAGKLVVRNMATGMYLAGVKNANGATVMGQSTTPFELGVTLGKPGVFLFNIGDTYANASSGGSVVAWTDANDPNAWWGFENVDASTLNNLYDYNWKVTPDAYQVLTLPISVIASKKSPAYAVIGLTADNKLALAEYTDAVPAGTPFILKAGSDVTNGEVPFEIAFEGDDFSEGGMLTYVFEPQAAEGLQGTICESTQAPAGYAYFNNGTVAATNNTEIGVNAGYIITPSVLDADEAAASAVIALGNIQVTSISDATVTVLPAICNVYTTEGKLVRKNVKSADAVKGLPAGIYVVGGVKVLVK